MTARQKLPTKSLSEELAALAQAQTVISEKTGGTELFTFGLTQTSFLSLSVLSLRGFGAARILCGEDIFARVKGPHLRRGLTSLVWECSTLSADSSESAFGMSCISVDEVRAVWWMLVRSLSSPSTLTIKSTEG